VLVRKEIIAVTLNWSHSGFLSSGKSAFGFFADIESSSLLYESVNIEELSLEDPPTKKDNIRIKTIQNIHAFQSRKEPCMPIRFQ
jgi:hypothetical protein